LPLETGQKLLTGVNHVSFITAKMEDKELGELTADEVTFLLRERHNITDPVKDDFVVHTMAEAKDMINTVLGGVTLLLAAIAAVSLLVGGVGIMNIMLISVTERTYEIGLRKAIGASRRDILIQFLLEALVLTGVGGIIGTILGALVSFLISVIAQAQGFDWPFVLKSSAWISAAGVSMAIGLIFGMYPALKASKLDPIEALRKE
jgi:putative ABC transport system permease protein